MVETPPVKKMGWREMLFAFIFMIWDGLGFFGFSPNKINRLKGQPPRWWDRFFNFKYMAVHLLFAAVVF